MADDALEFSISQYLDDSLSESERSDLEGRFLVDADASALLAEYRRLDMALKSVPLPQVRWDELAESISRSIDASQERRAPYRMPAWIRLAAPIAIAASLLLAAGVGIRVLLMSSPGMTPDHVPGVVSKPSAEQVARVEVFGPRAEGARAPIEISVSVGPAQDSGDEQTSVRYSSENEVVSRPSRVAVASGVAPTHDEEPLSSDMQ